MMATAQQSSSPSFSQLSDHSLAQESTREVIKSRFGEVVIDIRNALHFPRGMLGMNEQKHFALAPFPSPKMQQFTLLQSLDDFSLSFIALPLGIENPIIARADIEAAAREIGIGESALIVLALVCVHRTPEAVRLSVNARAPVLIDAARKAGGQHVFMHDRYAVQHFIS